LFPTRTKSRISHTLSYPATAKEISEALADVPQAYALFIDFFSYRRMKDRDKPFAVLSVHYDLNYALEREWSVQVRPVPRSLRHTVNGLLREQAFPAIHDWLLLREKLSSTRGRQSLTAIFSERDGSLRLKHFQSGGEAFSM
jgi:hypothetical protein